MSETPEPASGPPNEEPPSDASSPSDASQPSDPPAPSDTPPSDPPVPSDVPTPAAVPHDPPAAPAAPATRPAGTSDPAEWGRVGDDGTVWVRTSDGEREVGSYPGATPEEALAYFARKFDELEGQVALLEQRVTAGGVSPKDATTSIDHLREQVTDARAVGDLAGLAGRLDGLASAVEQRRAEADAARTRNRARALETKERIVGEVESLATSEEWKRTGDRMRALLDEWKAAPRLDRKTDDALWKRFSHARTAFDKRRRAHFAELDTQRAEAAVRKEKIIKEAEELSSSTDWGPTARRYRELMADWKAAGRGRRDVEDQLWARFRAAQDVFFNARGEVFSARDADLKVNLEAKLALLADAEKLLPVTDAREARTALRSIHERWEAAGHVPRADKDTVERRLRVVDDAVRAAEEAEWRRSNPEARARAEATVSQLRSSIAGLESDAEAAEQAGDTAKAESAREAAATRRTWLTEAERTLAEFS